MVQFASRKLLIFAVLSCVINSSVATTPRLRNVNVDREVSVATGSLVRESNGIELINEDSSDAYFYVFTQPELTLSSRSLRYLRLVDSGKDIVANLSDVFVEQPG